MIIRLLLVVIGIVLIITVRQSGALLDKLFSAADGRRREGLTAELEEDDDLTGKGKWRLIIVGYLIFILFAVFAAVSIYTLNQKINTLYGSVKNLEETVEELQQGE